MRVKRLIKHFVMEERNRSRITLGTGTRLDPQRHRLELVPNADGTYPTDADLQASTWVTNPTTVKQWLGFEAEVVHSRVDGVIETSLAFRLSDGADEFYWDGGDWAVSTTLWNTEEEVAANIATFPVASRQLAVVINLVTNHKDVTPSVKRIKVLWASTVEHQEDYIFRSLVPALRSQLRPIGELIYELASDTDTIDLTGVLEAPYNLVDVDSAFDQDSDLEFLTDLLSSYTPGTKVLVLSSVLATGTAVRIRFIYEPEINVKPSQSYYEVGKVPAVVIDRIALMHTERRAIKDWVVNRSDGSAVSVQCRQGDLDIQMRWDTDKSIDHSRISDEIARFFEQNVRLTAVGIDERFDLVLTDKYLSALVANRNDLHVGRCRFRIAGVLYWARDDDEHAVQRLVLQGDMDVTIE